MEMKQSDPSLWPNPIPTGTFATLHTKAGNGIRPMIEIVADKGQWIEYRGLFGGRRIKRTLRTRFATVHVNAQIG